MGIQIVITHACLPIAEQIVAGRLDEERSLECVIEAACSIGKDASETRRIFAWALRIVRQNRRAAS